VTVKNLPRYPIYVPSKGRADCCLTAKFLVKDEVPFYLVIEPQEQGVYAAQFGEARLLVLPFSNQGLIAARNWIKEHATRTCHKRHWQLDDNIWQIKRRYHGLRIPVDAGIALAVCEDFIDRYENVAVAGMNYEMFLPNGQRFPPFYVNVHVYSCSLVLNSLPYKWRTKYNDDTDLCLQVLAGGWCTILFNAFLVKKARTMTVKGGNTTDLYQGDGRLKMARALERLWPGVVRVGRKFQRPQHIIHSAWRKFDTPLKLKPGIKIDLETNEYGMVLKKVKDPSGRKTISVVES
jgi:hypothetical protein